MSRRRLPDRAGTSAIMIDRYAEPAILRQRVPLFLHSLDVHRIYWVVVFAYFDETWVSGGCRALDRCRGLCVFEEWRTPALRDISARYSSAPAARLTRQAEILNCARFGTDYLQHGLSRSSTYLSTFVDLTGRAAAHLRTVIKCDQFSAQTREKAR